MSEDEKFTHVRLRYDKITKHYYCDVFEGSKVYETLDLGTDKANVLKVVKLLKEEYDAIPVPPGFMN